MDKSTVGIMETGNVKSVLIKLTLPAIIGMLITSAYNVVDTLFVGAIGITSITAAISVVFPLFLFIGAVGLAFGIGGGTYVSRMLGAKRKNDADRIGSTVAVILAVLSILITILLLIFLKSILRAFGASDTVMPHAMAYARIIICGSVFTMGNMAMDCLVRAEGNSKFSMLVTVTGVVINVLLDPVFIFFFKLGLEGAAYATVLSQAISTLLFINYYKSGKSYINFSYKYFKPSQGLMKEVLKVGIPVFIKQVLICFSAGLINMAASRYGDFAVAAMGITMRVTSMGLMVIIGFSSGFQPFAAYSFGAGKTERLYEAIKVSILWLTGFSILFAVLLVFFAKNIVWLFSRDNDVIYAGVGLFRAFSSTLPFMGFLFIYGSLFEALGIGKYAFSQAISRQGVFFVPSLIIMQSFFGFKGVVLSQPLADLLAVLLTVILAIKLQNVIKKVHQKGDAVKEIPA